MRELRGPALRWRNMSENINYRMKQNRIIFRFNSSVPTQSSDKEVFQQKFQDIRKSRKLEDVPKMTTEKEVNSLFRAVWKALFVSIVGSVVACICYACYDPAYRRSTKYGFPYVYMISTYLVGEKETMLEKEEASNKAKTFKSAFLSK